jgi:hypothetical protein
VATADSRHGFDFGCVRERGRYDYWLDDWNRALRFQAAESHGLGWKQSRADRSLSKADTRNALDKLHT